MGLFSRKKDKKAEEEKAAAEAKRLAEQKAAEEEASGKPVKPEWLRSSKVDLGEVETALDIKTRMDSRSSILKMYEDRYGEKLDAPDFDAGLQYEYQLIEGGYVTGRELDELEKTALAAAGVTPKEEAKPTEGAKPTPTADGKPVEAAPTKVEGEKAKTEEKSAAKAKLDSLEKAPEAYKPGESLLDPNKKIDWLNSGVRCIFLGKPFWPLTALLKYKARKPQPWMNVLILPDLVILCAPIFIPLLYRAAARGCYEAYRALLRRKARKEEAEAKAKAARKAAKAKKKAARASRAY